MSRLVTLYHRLGQMPFFEHMADLFMDKALADPLLGILFRHAGPDHSRRFAHYLAQVLGGPSLYTVQDKGSEHHVLSRHIGRELNDEHKRRWLDLLLQSAREAGMPQDPEVTGSFTEYLHAAAEHITAYSRSAAVVVDRRSILPWDGRENH